MFVAGVGVGAVVVLAVVAPPAAAADPSLCSPARLPTFANRALPSSPAAGVGVRPVRTGSLDYFELKSGAPDTDGDGSADVVTEVPDGANGHRIELLRGDGTVSLGATRRDLPGSPEGSVFREGIPWFGDFDGDGRDDVIVFVATEAGDRQYLISGRLPPGRYDVAAVGTALPGPWAYEPAGDRDGDGTDDLRAWTLGGRTTLGGEGVVIRGRDAAAPGPGNPLPNLPRALESAPTDVLGLLQLDAGPPAWVVAGEARDSDVDVTVLGSPVSVLRTALVASQGFYGLGVSGYWSDGHRVISMSGITRSGGFEWLWDLDGPCPARKTASSIVVRRGDWLWKVARDALDARRLPSTSRTVHLYADRLYDANRAVIGPDQNRLRVGTILLLP